jgi:rhodanese-related sulfurtransferase
MSEMITAKELSQEIFENNAYRVIDIRDGDAYAAGHIPGALNIPFLRLEYKPGFVPEDLPVVIYAGEGTEEQAASEQAAEILREQGIDASVLEGGLPAWIENGYPLEYE